MSHLVMCVTRNILFNERVYRYRRPSSWVSLAILTILSARPYIIQQVTVIAPSCSDLFFIYITRSSVKSSARMALVNFYREMMRSRRDVTRVSFAKPLLWTKNTDSLRRPGRGFFVRYIDFPATREKRPLTYQENAVRSWTSKIAKRKARLRNPSLKFGFMPNTKPADSGAKKGTRVGQENLWTRRKSFSKRRLPVVRPR